MIPDQADKSNVLLHINLHTINQIINQFVVLELSKRVNEFSIVQHSHYKKLEDDSLIKSDSIVFLSDQRILVITPSPVLRIFCFEQDSFYDLNIQDVKKLINYKFSQASKELIIFYESHTDHKLYFSLYRITQNAINQLVQTKMIDSMSKDVDVSLYEIDKDLLSIIVYDKVTKSVIESHIFFRNGPLVITDDQDSGISIFNKKYYLEFE